MFLPLFCSPLNVAIQRCWLLVSLYDIQDEAMGNNEERRPLFMRQKKNKLQPFRMKCKAQGCCWIICFLNNAINDWGNVFLLTIEMTVCCALQSCISLLLFIFKEEKLFYVKKKQNQSAIFFAALIFSAQHNFTVLVILRFINYIFVNSYNTV